MVRVFALLVVLLSLLVVPYAEAGCFFQSFMTHQPTGDLRDGFVYGSCNPLGGFTIGLTRGNLFIPITLTPDPFTAGAYAFAAPIPIVKAGDELVFADHFGFVQTARCGRQPDKSVECYTEATLP